MSKPITPKFFANQITLQNMSVRFNQTWNGAAWVIDPATIDIVNTGNLVEDGTQATPATLTIHASDHPAAGQTALQDLFNYIETEMAAEYT